MNPARQSTLLKLLPSFTDFAFLMPVVFLFGRMGGMRDLLSDCDTGWHIRTGEWILNHHHVPAGDVFSFSKPGQPWFAWEWLSDVVYGWLYARGGLEWVVLFSVLLLGLTFAFLFRLLLRKSTPFIAIGVLMLAAAASSIHWLARPHLFTLFFLVLFYGALERVREGRTKIWGIPYLAILPVVTVLWTNLHGGFIAGIILTGTYGVAELLNLVFGGDARAALGRASGYLASAAASLAASLINPYTYHLHTHMAAYLRDPFNSEHINEFLSPNFHHPSALFFEGMLVLGAVAVCRCLWKGSLTEGLLLAIWGHGALLAARNIPIFVIAAALPAAAVLQEGLERLPEWNVAEWLGRAARKFHRLSVETAETDAIGRWHVISVLGMLLVAALTLAPNPPRKFRAEFDPKVYPAGALASLKGQQSARIFTHDEWGDYLIWKSRKVFVDGRSDFYGDDFEEKYMDILNVRGGWEKTLSTFGVDTVLMPPNTPLAGALKVSSRWQVVYDDGVAVVFRTPETDRRQNAIVCPTSDRRQEAIVSHTTNRGEQASVAANRGGTSRDREVTKTQASDQAITVTKSKT